MKKILLYLLALCATASATTLETQATDQMSWKPTAYNFQVPAYFSDGTEYFYGDGPYSMVIYKHQDAQLSYCSLLGNWACDDEAFPFQAVSSPRMPPSRTSSIMPRTVSSQATPPMVAFSI